MLSGMLEQLFGPYPGLLFLVILAGHHSCTATNNCAPSSCGIITNISYPFRLQTDPISCGRKEYELGCENNRTTLYLQRVKYYVQAIDYYPAFTIRLVDADVQKDDCLSIPRHSLQQGGSFDYGHYYPFSDVSDFPSFSYRYPFSRSFFMFTLTLISCPNPIPSPPCYFVNTSSCKNGSIYSPSFRHMEGYSYVMVSYDVEIAEVPDLCRIDLIYEPACLSRLYEEPSDFQPENITNMSLIYEAPSISQLENISNMSNVHDILAHGFQLSWWQAACDYAKENHLNLDNATTRYSYYCGDTRRKPRLEFNFNKGED
ncbi:hypothetical protein SADUNF_Sadunf07G0121200 [Salix dunnii]|uniref:Wall-associated receptor kinase galacturonan-binding domain-containing protein n=1 Tax=Salix dunnii TaxID=1413687 RepID=A0A835K238_9ROSI|nr:hypothetical protein SADUNF_Sadunf07G0121200 [Salix dunnii]